MLKKTAISFAIIAAIIVGAQTGAVKASVQPTLSTANIDQLSCSQARTMLEQMGYRSVKSTDCNGIQYRFQAERRNVRFVVIVNAESGGTATIPG